MKKPLENAFLMVCKSLARSPARAPAQIQTGSQGCVARDKNVTGC